MFAQIVGSPIDPIGAAVALAVLFITLCVFTTTYIGKRRSRIEINNDFKLAEIRLRNEAKMTEQNRTLQHEVELLKIDANKQIEFRRIDENMLTSHARDVSPGQGQSSQGGTYDRS